MLDKKHDGFFDEVTPEDRKSEELMTMLSGGGGNSAIKNFAEGEKVSGVVSRIGSEYLYVDIGAKNEALMKISELVVKGVLSVKPGDKVGGFIVSQVGGETIISKSLGGLTASISVLREALESRLPVQGKVTGVAKAGLNVKVLGHKAFCPVSQIDVKFTADVNEYLGKTLDFVITRITEGGKNIVVSRVPIFEADMEEELKKLTAAVGRKTPLKGKITKAADFGLFVQVGSLEGLVHISEISWERAQNLQESFTVGQEVEFIVLKVERKNPLRSSKISLSIKQALEDPWTKAQASLKVGQALCGKVTRLADFGAFVEVLPGVEGLVHVSEMAWGKRVHHPSEVVKAGQAVNVTVLAIDLSKRSVSLTLKDINDDPWKDAEKRFVSGKEVPGAVAKRAKFGYFIDLAEGVTGLLVHARIAADKKETLKVGETVTVMVDAIDAGTRRIALSLGMGAPEKESEETKQILQKMEAAKAEASSTEFGAALRAALKSKPKEQSAAPAAARAVDAGIDKELPVTARAVGIDKEPPVAALVKESKQ